MGLELRHSQARGRDQRPRDRDPGLSTFALEDGAVYHSYSTYDRGTDAVTGTWQLLDRVPKGRDDANHPDWPRRRYEYGSAEAGS